MIDLQSMRESSRREVDAVLRESTDEWRDEGTQNRVRLHSRPYKGSSYRLFKGVVQMRNVSFDRLMSLLWVDATQKKDRVLEFDSAVEELRVLEWSDENTRVDYVLAKLPWPVWDRDMIYLLAQEPPSRAQRGGRVYMLWAKSILHRGVAFSAKRYSKLKRVRLDVGIACYQLEESECGRHCTVTRIVHGDPGGSMPKMLVDRQVRVQVLGILEWLERNAKTPQEKRGRARL